MIRHLIGMGAAILIVPLLLLTSAPALAEKTGADALVGTPAPIFSLSGTHDRLIEYQKDYYGKHALVLTFFPAAFTPV